MLPIFPAMHSSEYCFPNSFPFCETGGFTPWDYQEPSYNPPPPPPPQEQVVASPQPPQEPVSSNSIFSDEPNSLFVSSPNSGSDEPNRNVLRNSSPCSDETNRSGSRVVLTDERKRKRMISNRESARRSRERKQRHLENLTNEVNRLKIGNTELSNRLRLVVVHNQLVSTENDNLRTEAVILRQKLANAIQTLVFRQHLNASAWPCNNVTSIYDEQLISPHQSLIT